MWSELALHFPGSKWSEDARYWYAMNQAELGRPEVGLLALEQAAKASPGDKRLRERVKEFKSMISEK